MTDDPRQQFNAMRFRRMDELRRDHSQSAAARIVGAELFTCLNSVSGQAWPSQATLVQRLGLDLRRVKRAVKSLDGVYLKVDRTRGTVNFYTPIWKSAAAGDQNSQTGLVGIRSSSTSDKKHPGTGDKKHPGTGDKKHPVSLTRNPSSIPARADHQHQEGSVGVPIGFGNRDSRGESLTGQRDDGAVELKAINMFNGAGLDGIDIVSSLHEIDNGLPRLRLFCLIRGGTVTGDDLRIAALAVREHESRKTAHRDIAAKRSRDGAA